MFWATEDTYFKFVSKLLNDFHTVHQLDRGSQETYLLARRSDIVYIIGAIP
jgi:hypothetical protein